MNINLNNVEASFTWSDNLVGVILKEGDKVIDWNDLTREQQIKVLNGFVEIHGLFRRFLKEE